MSRIRTVKPDLFRHEKLFDAECETRLPLRLCYIGLFTVADCEGRFIWKPRTLKLDILPHDAIEFGPILDALARYGFIKKYRVGGETYGLIPTFTKHQIVQTKEKERGSLLPAPPPDSFENSTGTVPEPYQSDTSTVAVSEQASAGTQHPSEPVLQTVDFVENDQNSTGTVPEPYRDDAGLVPESQEKEKEKEKEGGVFSMLENQARAREGANAATTQPGAAESALAEPLTDTPSPTPSGPRPKDAPVSFGNAFTEKQIQRQAEIRKHFEQMGIATERLKAMPNPLRAIA